MKQTQDIRVSRIVPLPTPQELKERIVVSEQANRSVVESRQIISNILTGKDPRFLLVVGPCSIHNTTEALDYATRLVALRDKVADRMYVVMRTYFAKPRTTVGWKGFMYDPHMDDSCDISFGLTKSRELANAIVSMGLPIGMEALDPITIRYFTDLLAWASIGARTVESQVHREMASGLSMPVGFKNGTDGNVQVALDALSTASQPHTFVGINNQGVASVVRTRGNMFGHIVLRGGQRVRNFDAESIRDVTEKLTRIHQSPTVVIDCSHGNSGKNHDVQKDVFRHVLDQRIQGNTNIIGAMLESYLHSGRQAIPTDLSQLLYGTSVTDACLGWAETQELLQEAYANLQSM